MENWVKIYSSADLMKVKIAEDILKQEGIVSHIKNKPDTMMPMLGEAELYTPVERSEEAIRILKSHGIE